MVNSNKKYILAFVASFVFWFSGCVSACDKVGTEEPDFVQDSNVSKPGDSDGNSSEIEPTLDLYTVIIPDSLPSQTKMYTGFFLSFNKDNHTPNYVTWELTSEETSGSNARADSYFHRDPELEGCPDEKGYRYSGYDRGHMCPAADQKWSYEAQYDCHVMSNMCPQINALNAGAWATLESKERQWAKRDGNIWISCGPIYYDFDQTRIGTYDTRVPSAFFKAFLYYNGDKSRAIAFVYPNQASPGNMQDYAMSIDDLERETGYDFFSALPDDIENKIEAEFSFKEWNK